MAATRNHLSEGWDLPSIGKLIGELETIRSELEAFNAAFASQLAALDASQRTSAGNLLHYVALRRYDLRELQAALAGLGLSSLGRAEPHVLANLDAVLRVLRYLSGRHMARPEPASAAGDYASGFALLEARTQALLGSEPPGRSVRIMVTMGPEAASDYSLVKEMVAAGMNCARINCAHDEAAAWKAMAEHLRRAQRELGKPCRILMDLGGAKPRTGPIEPSPPVFKLRPKRDSYGRVLQPARVWLEPLERPSMQAPDADLCLKLPAAWLAQLALGDRIEFTDARGADRKLTVTAVHEQSRLAELRHTAYLLPDSELRKVAREPADDSVQPRPVAAGDLPVIPQTIRLNKGDTLLLVREPYLGRPAVQDVNGNIVEPARVSCSFPEVFADVHAGERILLDDGKIAGVVRAASADGLTVEITQAREGGERLAADKGVNFPDSTLRLPALTEKDIRDLESVVGHADLVGLSFVQRDSDIRELQRHLQRLNGTHLGIVLKIETRTAFDNLPSLLLTAMAAPSLGVMIARGDLAVEVGYERLAEVQEEILWLSQAAHVPVIWATQVLESLAKGGLPSRAEITDAAMGERAECVMLNKGPHVLDAIHTLDGILRRMESHQAKKSPMLRRLRAWDALRPHRAEAAVGGRPGEQMDLKS